MFSIGQRVEYKTHDGQWFTGTIVEGPSRFGDYIIDATVIEYRPDYVTRTASYMRALYNLPLTTADHENRDLVFFHCTEHFHMNWASRTPYDKESWIPWNNTKNADLSGVDMCECPLDKYITLHP